MWSYSKTTMWINHWKMWKAREDEDNDDDNDVDTDEEQQK